MTKYDRTEKAVKIGQQKEELIEQIKKKNYKAQLDSNKKEKTGQENPEQEKQDKKNRTWKKKFPFLRR